MGDSELLKQMGQRIMQRRKAMCLTQEELAERLGVSMQMVSNLELGKKAIRPDNLVKVSQVLGLSCDFILTGNESDDTLSNISSKLSGLDTRELNIISELIDYMSENN